MSIDWFRDLVICISGLAIVGLLVFIAVILYSLYRRIKHLMDSMIGISETVHGISSTVKELGKPLFQVTAIIKGVRTGIDTAGKLFKKRKGERDG